MDKYSSSIPNVILDHYRSVFAYLKTNTDLHLKSGPVLARSTVLVPLDI